MATYNEEQVRRNIATYENNIRCLKNGTIRAGPKEIEIIECALKNERKKLENILQDKQKSHQA